MIGVAFGGKDKKMLHPDTVLFGQIPANTPADGVFYAVSYVETRPDATKAARATLEQYRAASRKQDGFVRVEFFEQVGGEGAESASAVRC